MKGQKSRIVPAILVLGGLVISQLAEASHISVTGPPPQLHLGVGTLGSTIDMVTFTVPAGSEGSGVAVQGDQSILIEVAIRRGGGAGGGFTIAFLTADSSTPLASSFSTIPVTDISWTSDNGQIPSNTYNGTPNQLLLVFFAPLGNTRRESTHTFFYANTSTYPGGTYTGRVVYTATVL